MVGCVLSQLQPSKLYILSSSGFILYRIIFPYLFQHSVVHNVIHASLLFVCGAIFSSVT